MLQDGREVFVNFAGGSKMRVLHPAKVTGTADGSVTVKYCDPDGIPSEPSESVTLFFDGPQEFMQQPGQRVDAEPGADPEEHTDTFQLLGEPVSAESRKCYRVGTALADYSAKIGDLGVCKLVDVSAAGVGFLSATRFNLGDQLGIEICVNGTTSTGIGFIQSVKEVKTGYRYGLLCLEDRGEGGLARGLQQLTMDAQRTQLRRLAGAA